MLEALIQATAIANYGNVAIAARDASTAADSIKGLSIFAGIESWDFERCTAKGRAISLASLPAVWFRRIMNEEVLELKLALGNYTRTDLDKWPDPINSQIGIYCEGNAGIEIWKPEWKVTGYKDGRASIKCTWSAARSVRQFRYEQPDPRADLSKWRGAVEALTAFLEAHVPVWKLRFAMLLTLDRQGDLDMGRFKEALPPSIGDSIAKLCYANAIRTHLMISSEDFNSLRSSFSSNQEFSQIEGDVLQSIADLLECASSQVVVVGSKKAA